MIRNVCQVWKPPKISFGMISWDFPPVCSALYDPSIKEWCFWTPPPTICALLFLFFFASIDKRMTQWRWFTQFPFNRINHAPQKVSSSEKTPPPVVFPLFRDICDHVWSLFERFPKSVWKFRKLCLCFCLPQKSAELKHASSFLWRIRILVHQKNDNVANNLLHLKSGLWIKSRGRTRFAIHYEAHSPLQRTVPPACFFCIVIPKCQRARHINENRKNHFADISSYIISYKIDLYIFIYSNNSR